MAYPILTSTHRLHAQAVDSALRSPGRLACDRAAELLAGPSDGAEHVWRCEIENTLEPATDGDMHIQRLDSFRLDLRTSRIPSSMGCRAAVLLPALEHTVTLDLSKILSASFSNASTVITVLPLTECLKFAGITDGRLFAKNVRQSLGSNNKVNRELKRTIHSERVRDFMFLHNGVTAICDSITLNPDRTKLTLKGVSVVNGCQSLNTIYTYSERVRAPEAKDAHILFRFNEIKDRGFGDRISINTNSQSAVKQHDLRSNDRVMVGLKRAFETRYPNGAFLTKRGFYYAGGLPAVLKELLPLLDPGALTVNGKTLGENVATAPCHDPDVIRPLALPLAPEGGTVILFGNLCSDGAVLKQSAASEHLLAHRGRAVVFEDHEEMARRIDDPGLPIDETSVLVLKNAGPKGAPGMPEWGAAPIPARLLKAGVKDMVRISDARMSGTSYGTVILHVAPESAVGGPLALVHDGDLIELDVPHRRLTLQVDDAELGRRRAAWTPARDTVTGGYLRLFRDHVLQANEGVDFDFLRGMRPVRDEDTTRASRL